MKSWQQYFIRGIASILCLMPVGKSARQQVKELRTLQNRISQSYELDQQNIISDWKAIFGDITNSYNSHISTAGGQD